MNIIFKSIKTANSRMTKNILTKNERGHIKFHLGNFWTVFVVTSEISERC